MEIENKNVARAPNFTSNEINIILDNLEKLPELRGKVFSSKFKAAFEIAQGWDEIVEDVNSIGKGFKRKGNL